MDYAACTEEALKTAATFEKTLEGYFEQGELWQLLHARGLLPNHCLYFKIESSFSDGVTRIVAKHYPPP